MRAWTSMMNKISNNMKIMKYIKDQYKIMDMNTTTIQNINMRNMKSFILIMLFTFNVCSTYLIDISNGGLSMGIQVGLNQFYLGSGLSYDKTESLFMSTNNDYVSEDKESRVTVHPFLGYTRLLRDINTFNLLSDTKVGYSQAIYNRPGNHITDNYWMVNISESIGFIKMFDNISIETSVGINWKYFSSVGNDSEYSSKYKNEGVTIINNIKIKYYFGSTNKTE